MSNDLPAKTEETAIDVTIPIMPWHFDQFEVAKSYIEKIYGKAPSAETLMHLCLCKASWEIVNTFKTAIEEVVQSGLLDAEDPDSEEILAL